MAMAEKKQRRGNKVIYTARAVDRAGIFRVRQIKVRVARR